MQIRLKQKLCALAITGCCPFLLASTNGTQSGTNKDGSSRSANQKEQDSQTAFFSNMFAKIQGLFGRSFAKEKTQKAKNWMDALTLEQKQKLFNLLQKINQEWLDGIKEAGIEAEDVVLENILFFLIAHKDFLQNLQKKALPSESLTENFAEFCPEASTVSSVGSAIADHH